MECQLCNCKVGEETVTALGIICGYCADEILQRLFDLENEVARLRASKSAHEETIPNEEQ